LQSRLGGTNASTINEAPTVRVYGPGSSLNRSIADGVFKHPSYWGARFKENQKLAQSMRNADANPDVGRNRLLVVDVASKTWIKIGSDNRQYGCPAWSPSGHAIAAVLDETPDQRPMTYGVGSQYIGKSTLALFEGPRHKERRVELPTMRVRRPVWTPQGDHLAFIAENSTLPYSFSRIAKYSIATRELTYLATPRELAPQEITYTRGGTLLAKLWDRFGLSLWTLDKDPDKSEQVQTFGWHIGYQFGSFAEIPLSGVVLVAESATFKGRVVLVGGPARQPQLIYDANPHVKDFRLGDQRRITWKNRAGEDVDGIVILPPDYQRSLRYPVIVNAYPRPAWNDFKLSAQHEDTGQVHAAHGYVIFRPAIRSPIGAYWYTRGESYTERARGVAGIPIMIDDFESGIDHLVREGIVDPERVGLFGHSNGGWVANLLITRSKYVKAAVIEAGISNAILMSSFPFPMLTRGQDPATNGNMFDNLNDYIELSPIFKMRDVTIPVLLMIGDQDWLWLPQMMAQYGTLRSEGRDVELVRYSNEAHVLLDPNSAQDGLKRVLDFFDSKLTGSTRTGHAEKGPSEKGSKALPPQPRSRPPPKNPSGEQAPRGQDLFARFARPILSPVPSAKKARCASSPSSTIPRSCGVAASPDPARADCV
jgi:dipeptidyl aminopeptidase/acylaminoacyl peptidase